MNYACSKAFARKDSIMNANNTKCEVFKPCCVKSSNFAQLLSLGYNKSKVLVLLH